MAENVYVTDLNYRINPEDFNTFKRYISCVVWKVLIKQICLLDYTIIIVNTVQCHSICRYLLPLHVSVS
jgi:hypothetical protein